MAWVIGGFVVLVVAAAAGVLAWWRAGVGGVNRLLIGIVERGELRIDPVPPELVPKTCAGAVRALEELGFRACGAVATKPGSLPVSYSVLLLSGDAQSYARVSAMTDLDPGPPTVGITSYFDGRVLDTATVNEAVADPARFTQLLPGRPPDILVAKHYDRLRALAVEGLVAHALTPDSLPDRVRQDWIDDVRGMREFGLTRTSS